ncbi:TOBE domain-containing protein, partial [Thioclava sp. UBA3469]|uniref:TOBE domain-containing protein n=1 Tax=Thioclava sp. UBA3469 TaxID=1947693 RepID=UPI00257C0FB0
FVTHDQEEALVMSDRIAVMFEGEIAQLADPEVLYGRPNSRRVADFIGVMNFLPASVTDGSGDAVTAEVAGLGRLEVAQSQISSAPAGDGAAVGFRPETLTLLYEGQQASDREAPGTIDEVVYYGDMTYYDVRLDGTEKPVRISMRNVFGRPVLEVGTRTRVAWSPGALVLFR